MKKTEYFEGNIMNKLCEKFDELQFLCGEIEDILNIADVLDVCDAMGEHISDFKELSSKINETYDKTDIEEVLENYRKVAEYVQTYHRKIAGIKRTILRMGCGEFD